MKKKLIIGIALIIIVITVISIINFSNNKKEEKERMERTVSTVDNINQAYYKAIKELLENQGLKVEEKEDVYSEELMNKGKKIIVDGNEIEIYQTMKNNALNISKEKINNKIIIIGKNGIRVEALIFNEITILKCNNAELEKKLINIFEKK